MGSSTPGAAEHALQRSISSLAIGVARDVAKARAATLPNRVAERAEDFQIRASGLATDVPTWQTAEIDFSNCYTQATGRRPTSTLTRPQIHTAFEQTSGISLLSDTGRLVPVLAHLSVIEWSITEDDVIDGCTFACAATAPGDQVQFQGFYHLTIQGFGAPLEDRDTGD